MSAERILAAAVGAALLRGAVVAAQRSMRRWGTPIDVLPTLLLVWGIVLVLFSVPVIDYSTTAPLAWVVLYGSIGTSVLGCMAARRIGQRRAGFVSASEASQRLREGIHAGRLRELWLVSALLGLVGFAAFLYAVGRVLGWSAVLTDGGAVREVKRDSVVFQETYGSWKFLTNFNQVAFILWSIGVRSGAFTDRWRWARLTGITSVLPFLFTADRGLLIALLTWAALVHVLWPVALSWRRIAVIGVLGAVVAGTAITAIGNRYGGSLDAHPEVAAHATRALDPIVIPYLYLTANIPTFGQLTEDGLAPVNYGQMTVLPFVKAAHAAGIPGTSPVGTGVFYPIPFESFSNYSWLGTFWLDLRAPGVLLLAALVGWVATYARGRFARAPSVANLWMASLLLYVIVLSPFANALTSSLVWQYLLLTPLVAVALDRQAAARARVLLRMRFGRTVAVGVAFGALAVGAAVVMLRPSTQGRSSIDVITELKLAIRKSRYVYSEQGRYPEPLSLATRLQVNRPEVPFRPQNTYTEDLPPAPAIAVYTGPSDVFVRLRARDGRVFEAHRTEEYGGVTFGPGTRD